MNLCIRGGVFIVLSLVMGCSDDDDGGGPPGRGTATCNQWQNALCQWHGRCTMPGNGACDQIRGVACKSDSEAERCATQLSSATCSAPPSNCDVSDIGDPAPAKKACEDLSVALCQKSEQCQPGSNQSCLQDVQSTLPCADFIGVTLAYEQCMTEIRALACSKTMMPDICKGVLLR